MQDTILKALQWRYATQVFDPEKKISSEELHTILESGRLAPSCFGFEPWKFIVVEKEEIKEKLKEASYGKAKVKDAPYVIIIAYRTDAKNMSKEIIDRVVKTQNANPSDLQGYKDMMDNSLDYAQKQGIIDSWMKAQTYIPLGIMIETAALLGIDAGPMEGFNAQKVDEILGLKEKNLSSSTMLLLGHRGEDASASRPKVRRSFEEVVEFVKKI